MKYFGDAAVAIAFSVLANAHARFVVLVSDRDLARKTFTSHNFVKVCLVPMAELIMGANAWVFLDGRPHIEFRKGLVGLFTRRSLQSYLPIQEKVWSDYFQKFVAASEKNGGRPMEHMTHFREINCALSCRTFVGNYISDEAVKKIADDYYCITAALELVNIPLSLYIPYTKVWLGKRAADGVLAEFARCAAASKRDMAAGQEPICIVDQVSIILFLSPCGIFGMVSSKMCLNINKIRQLLCRRGRAFILAELTYIAVDMQYDRVPSLPRSCRRRRSRR
ncbi:MAG: hypothetical protein CL912_27445 [Deltaproteobacteria bacterium]|nr:hypothetical protein [Deltaproteobacteria bacterium]